MQAMFAGIATVAIASKMAPSFPELTKRYRMAYTITSEEMDDGLYGEIGQRHAMALAQSIEQTKERLFANFANSSLPSYRYG